MRDPIVAVPADQPAVLSGVDSKPDIKKIEEIMTELHISIIAKEIAATPSQVKAVSALLDEGATVPFIARYRKEATGSLDEVAITAIRDKLQTPKELGKRRE